MSSNSDPPPWSDRYQTASQVPPSPEFIPAYQPEASSPVSQGPVQQMLRQSSMSLSRRSTIPMPPSGHPSRQNPEKSHSLNSNSYYDSNGPFVYVDQPSAQVISLNNTLTSFETTISPWKEPSEWIEADEKNTTLIIQRAVHLLASEDIGQASFAGRVMVYPVSSAYIRPFKHAVIRHISML